MSKRSWIIGIGGPRGAGRRTLARKLKNHFGKKAAVISIGDYLLPEEKLPRLEGYINRDSPAGVDFKRLAAELDQLRHGKTVLHEDGFVIEPARFIFVVGKYAFWNERIRHRYDWSFYLSVPVAAGIRRSAETRKLSNGYVEKVLTRMHHEHVTPTEKHAETIFDAAAISNTDIFHAVCGILSSHS